MFRGLIIKTLTNERCEKSTGANAAVAADKIADSPLSNDDFINDRVI